MGAGRTFVLGDVCCTIGDPPVLMTAKVALVPESSTWALMLIGFAGIGFAGYRRARAGHAKLAT
jgi:hypothetical protein